MATTGTSTFDYQPHGNWFMTLAETITNAVLLQLGYQRPERTSDWSELCETVQDCIDEEMDVMRSVAAQEANTGQGGKFPASAFMLFWGLGSLFGGFMCWSMSAGLAKHQFKQQLAKDGYAEYRVDPVSGATSWQMKQLPTKKD
jgi:hypothetical protein